MNKLIQISFFFILLASIYGCLQEDNSQISVDNMTIESIVVPTNFNYSTTKDIEVTLSVPAQLNNAVFSLVAYNTGNEDYVIGKGVFGSSGIFNSSYTIPAYFDTIVVRSEYVGLVDGIIIPITGSTVSFDYKPLYDNTVTKSVAAGPVSLKSASADSYTYMGTFSSSGVPNYLIQSDVIDKNLLDDVNASLPEYTKVPVLHPEFIASGTETNLVITKKADVWVTFVHEGAGYKNSLGYYSYKVGSQPKSKAEIQALTVILPNVSYSGSGGGLASGNKVYLGQFDANTVVAWFLVADGWNGSGVGAGRGIYFSDPELNPETNPALQSHMVLLWDKSRNQMLMGFEDINRQTGGSDQDFNDAIFYASSNPIDAIQKTNVQAIVAANDSDGDGINDELDDFPYDPNKAFNNFSPSALDFGTVAYEDLWPSKGDYDFNDVVVDYQYNMVANSQNLITSIEGSYFVKHIGGSYNNGFAIVLPVANSVISSVENQVMNAGYVNLNSNGTESGVNETVIFVSENISQLQGDTIRIKINLQNPVSKSNLGSAPYNAFIVVNGERDREVHLPDLQPTSKGTKYLGQGDDYSSVADGRYFKTDRNLPWALNFYESFAPPAEKQSVDKAYPRFIYWANSGGTKDLDWYK